MSQELELSIGEIKAWGQSTYQFVDIRDEEAFQYGAIEDAIHIPEEKLESHIKELQNDIKYILYCSRGGNSLDAAKVLRKQKIEAYSLKGGYTEWILKQVEEAAKEEQERCKQIESSIRKKFHKELFGKFAKAINTYQLLEEGDKVAVCISGGKDSMLMAKLFQELQRHHKFQFELVFLVMDPGYNAVNRAVIENNAELMHIPIQIFETQIFEAVYEIEKSPCYLCARMRRGYLYKRAQELGCNKIALGHHYDDVIETILMGMTYGAQIQTMMPKLHSTNFKGMELIRPMYLIREEDIKHWRDYNQLHFIQCACRFTDTCTTCRSDGSIGSKRMETKLLIEQLRKVNPYVESNIFKSVENVNLNTIIAYKQNGVKHPFLEHYKDNTESDEERIGE